MVLDVSVIGGVSMVPQWLSGPKIRGLSGASCLSGSVASHGAMVPQWSQDQEPQWCLMSQRLGGVSMVPQWLVASQWCPSGSVVRRSGAPGVLDVSVIGGVSLWGWFSGSKSGASVVDQCRTKRWFNRWRGWLSQSRDPGSVFSVSQTSG